MDLLLAADWTPVDQAPKPEPVRVEPEAPAPSPAREDKRWLALLGAVLLLGAGLGWLRRK
jgi:LPXTG-motif cell wall-anchored protein